MSIREKFENRENNFMSNHGCRSSGSRGREQDERRCPVRTEFQLDRDRIVYSNAFRRLKHKTQVFLSPLGDEYRTRLTHTLEVAQMARNVSRALFLNEDLAEAVALGHDLGHTPFGHSGETVLREIFSPDFSHNEQSLRVVDVLENNGRGLNLTFEVRDGILKHSKGYGEIIPDDPDEMASTLEGRIVRITDIMAYLNHDLDDAIRTGIITEDQIPENCVRVIGTNHSERAATMINDLISFSREQNGSFELGVGDAMYEAMNQLREFLYQQVYRSPQVHNQFEKAKKVLSDLYHYFLDHEDELQQELDDMGMGECNHSNQSLSRRVCDFIASMTDSHAMGLYRKIFFPSPLN